MSTDKTPTPDDVIRARVAQWCAWTGIDPARLAAIIAEVRALPGVAQTAQLRTGWVLQTQATRSDHWQTWEGICGPSQVLTATLVIASGGLTYPQHPGVTRHGIEAGEQGATPGGLVAYTLARYAAELDAAEDAEGVKLRDPARKAKRDAEVRDARAAAAGLRAIVARLRAEMGAVQP